MKINISKKEYRLLLEMLYLSDWMMHSHLVDPEGTHHEHEALRKKLLSYFKEMQAEDIIEYAKESDAYYEANEFDNYIHEKFISSYDEATFWDELMDRLAVRDVIKDIGIEQYQSMEGLDRITKLEAARERYANEFEQHGLEHVKIDHGDLTKN